MDGFEKILHDVLAADALLAQPLYAGLTDAEIADAFNAPTRTRVVAALDYPTLYLLTDFEEFRALSAEDQAHIRDVWSLSSIPLLPTDKPFIVYHTVFASDSKTLTALDTALNVPISRREELNLGIEKVGAHHIAFARDLDAHKERIRVENAAAESDEVRLG